MLNWCLSIKPPLATGPQPVMLCDRDADHPGPHRNGATVWEDKDPQPPQLTEQDITIRMWAVEKVFQWVDTFEEDEDGDEELVTVTPTLIVQWAQVFEDYIRGE